MKHSKIFLKNTNDNLPNMEDVIIDWFLDITLEIVDATPSGADFNFSVSKIIKTKGVVRPPSDTNLKIRPEGTWHWQWLQLHCLANVNIELNQFVIYDGKKYKVMDKKDYSKYGYMRYDIAETFEG